MPWHVGDIAASWVLQVGNQSHPRLRSPLLDRIADVVESRTKCFESYRIIYIIYRRVGFFLLLSPFVALVRLPDIEFWLFSPQISLKKFRITRVSWNHSDGLWWEHCLGASCQGFSGSVPGSWALRCCHHNFIVAILEYLRYVRRHRKSLLCSSLVR